MSRQTTGKKQTAPLPLAVQAESDLQEILEDGSCVIKRKEGEETISGAAWFCKSMQEPLSENKQFRGYFALLAS